MALGAHIQAELTGLTTAQRYLNEILRRGENAQPLMMQIARIGEETTEERITTTNIGPNGVAWKKSARAKADGGKTLFHTGRLAQIHSEATATVARWGTNHPGGAIHQTGGTIEPKNGKALHFPVPGGGFVTVKKVNMPARPYLGISPADQEEIEAAIEDYFLDGLAGTA